MGNLYFHHPISVDKSFISLVKLKNIRKETYLPKPYYIIDKRKSFPFQFLEYNVYGRKLYENDTIDQRIFIHERTHIEQNHSLDLLILNTLKVFTWFNPVLFLYKKAMITNHEFSADEAVVKSNCNIKDYQNLILEEILNHQNPPLTHSFNFNNTKKKIYYDENKNQNLVC